MLQKASIDNSLQVEQPATTAATEKYIACDLTLQLWNESELSICLRKVGKLQISVIVVNTVVMKKL